MKKLFYSIWAYCKNNYLLILIICLLVTQYILNERRFDSLSNRIDLVEQQTSAIENGIKRNSYFDFSDDDITERLINIEDKIDNIDYKLNFIEDDISRIKMRVGY